MRLELGKAVRCSDERYGKLADIVIDPIAKRVTHLVVRPEKGDDIARLVPIELVEPDKDDTREIKLRCTAEDVRRLDHVQEFAYLRLGEYPASDPDWDVGSSVPLPSISPGLSAGGGLEVQASLLTACQRERSKSGARAW
jgi:sporulation protein YlmC with PRC-barrel domain